MITKLKPYRHSDETTNVSLYYLRAQIIRDGLEGLGHVNALLRLRGLDPDAVKVPRKNKRVFRNGEFRRSLLTALRDGPKDRATSAEGFRDQLSHITHTDRLKRVTRCLLVLEAKGLVRRDGRVRGLA